MIGSLNELVKYLLSTLKLKKSMTTGTTSWDKWAPSPQFSNRSDSNNNKSVSSNNNRTAIIVKKPIQNLENRNEWMWKYKKTKFWKKNLKAIWNLKRNKKVKSNTILLVDVLEANYIRTSS